MKTVLPFAALFSLVALSSAAALEAFQVSLPAFVTAEAALSLFVGTFVLLGFFGEYSRRPVLDLLRASPRRGRGAGPGRPGRLPRYRAARPLAA